MDSEHEDAAHSSLISGNAAFKTGDFEQALACWSQALLASWKDRPAILANRSAAYGHLGLWKKALSDAEQVRLKTPKQGT